MSVGVVIGRFQVPYLHEWHCALIDAVRGEAQARLRALAAAE